MKPLTLALAAILTPGLMPGAALAQATGDAAAGAEHFDRQCISCHVVVDEAGETLAGRTARTGPNLYAIVGRTPGTVPDFDYSDDMLAYGETGAVWEEATFVPYVMDPTGFLREALGDPRARGKMAFRVREEQEALDLYAFLASLAPAEAEAPPSEAATE